MSFRESDGDVMVVEMVDQAPEEERRGKGTQPVRILLSPSSQPAPPTPAVELPTPLLIPEPHPVSTLASLSIWFKDPLDGRIKELPLLGAHYDLQVWSNQGMLKLFATFSNSSMSEIEAAVMVPSKEGKLTHAVVRVVTPQNEDDPSAKSMKTYESVVVDKEDLVKEGGIEQTGRQRGLTQAPPQLQTMSDEGANQPKAHAANGIIKFLSEKPVAGVSPLPIPIVAPGQTIAVELEFSMEAHFDPISARYKIRLPTGYCTKQLSKVQSLVPGECLPEGGSQSEGDLINQIQGILSYSIHIHVPRVETNQNATFTITSPTHDITPTLLSTPLSLVQTSFSTYHITIDRIRLPLPRPIQQENRFLEQFTPQLSLDYDLPRSAETVDVLALKEADIPPWDFAAGRPEKTDTESGSFWIQMNAPSILPKAQRAGVINISSDLDPSWLPDLSQRVIFIMLDVSGSMAGMPWTALCTAVCDLIRNLSEVSDYVNVILFHDEVFPFFTSPRLADEEMKDSLIRYLKDYKIKLDAGTTAMTSAIQKALSQAAATLKTTTGGNTLQYAQPYIYLATDGSVDDEGKVVDLVNREYDQLKKALIDAQSRSDIKRVRIMTLALGPYANQYFLEHLSRSTGGGRTLVVLTAVEFDHLSKLMAKQFELYGGASSSKTAKNIPLKDGEVVTSAICLRNIEVKLEWEQEQDAFAPASNEYHESQDEYLFNTAQPRASSSSSKRPDLSAIRSYPSLTTASIPDLTFGASLNIFGTYAIDKRFAKQKRFPRFITVTGIKPNGRSYKGQFPIRSDFTMPLGPITQQQVFDAEAAYVIGGIPAVGSLPVADAFVQKSPSCIYPDEPMRAYLKNQLIRQSTRLGRELPWTTRILREVPVNEQQKSRTDQKEQANMFEVQRQKQYELYINEQQRLANQAGEAAPPPYAGSSSSSSTSSSSYADPSSVPRPVYVVSKPKNTYASRSYSSSSYSYGGYNDVYYDPYFTWYGGPVWWGGGGHSSIGSYYLIHGLGSGIGSLAHSLANAPTGLAALFSGHSGIFSILNFNDMGCCRLCCSCEHVAMQLCQSTIAHCCLTCDNLCKLASGLSCLPACGHLLVQGCSLCGVSLTHSCAT